MSAVLEIPRIKNLQTTLKKAIVQAMKNRFRAVFFDVEYKTFDELIEEFPKRRNPRLIYDRGILEVMPLPEHDISERIIDAIVDVITEEYEIDFANYGSSTQKRARLERGFEPDSSLYIGENAELMRYRDRFLETDPPPDLVFEVDVTHSSVDRFALMAVFGVKEIWQSEKKRLKILHLENDGYVEREESTILPNVTSAVLNDFIASSKTQSRAAWRKEIRDWAQANPKK